MSVYKKLQEARIKLQNTELKKSGHNKFAGYKYFELGDFKKAEELWAKAKGLVPADSEFARSMEENITAARAEASQKNTQKK